MDKEEKGFDALFKDSINGTAEERVAENRENLENSTNLLEATKNLGALEASIEEQRKEDGGSEEEPPKDEGDTSPGTDDI